MKAHRSPDPCGLVPGRTTMSPDDHQAGDDRKSNSDSQNGEHSSLQTVGRRSLTPRSNAMSIPSQNGSEGSTRASQRIGNGSILAAMSLAAAAMAVAGIKPDEGKVNRTYLDVAAIPTYCYGHADRTSKVGTPHTDAQCETILAADVKVEQQGVAACVPALRSRPYQWAASTRLAHNIGVSAFCHSGAAIHFNRGDWRGGCHLFLPWDKARVAGKLAPVRGLALRRQRERGQCLKGLAA